MKGPRGGPVLVARPGAGAGEESPGAGRGPRPGASGGEGRMQVGAQHRVTRDHSDGFEGLLRVWLLSCAAF